MFQEFSEVLAKQTIFLPFLIKWLKWGNEPQSQNIIFNIFNRKVEGGVTSISRI